MRWVIGAAALAAVTASGATLALHHTPEPTVAPPAPAWSTYPPCAAEDGPAPCVWNAQEAGNAIGTSFYLGPDHCTYRFGPAGTYRDTEFPCEDPYAAERQS